MKGKIRLLKILSLITFFSVVFNFYLAVPKVALARPKNIYTENDFVLISSFTTSFSSSTEERCHNIKLATSKIDGYFLEPSSVFSFNACVGKRTEKEGYKKSKIIVGGKFVDGIGGGVCQVSTTLYNAVMRAGLKVVEHHPHTLAVSYVSPSTDAMVNSSFADLKFVNETKLPIYIKAVIKDKKLRFDIYGESSEFTYQLVGNKTADLPILEPEIIYDENMLIGTSEYLSYGVKGKKSEAYLCVYRQGKLVKKTLVRRDTYKSIAPVIVKGTKEVLEENPF